MLREVSLRWPVLIVQFGMQLTDNDPALSGEPSQTSAALALTTA